MGKNGREPDYTDKEINDFLDLAQEIGIGRAIRKLGYPKAWSTAQRWAKNRGVDISKDKVMAQAKAIHLFMDSSDAMFIAEEGMARVAEELRDNARLSPDDHKKLSEAFQKYLNSWRLAQEKATDIKHSYERTQQDIEIEQLLDEFKQQQAQEQGN
jgi:hypothetical protein